MEALIAVTYRCNAKCYMCNIWQNPSKAKDEITIEDIKKLPDGLDFANITGGEPFLRDDIEEIVKVILSKTKKLVISTNGYLTEKIVNLARKYPEIGFRVSIDGFPKKNDELRGLKDGFDHGIRTLLILHKLGIKNLGFGMTISEKNIEDMMPLYNLAKLTGFEFSLALSQNSFYFHKFDNKFENKNLVLSEVKRLINEQLKSNKPKDWFRAYFNRGYINLISNDKRIIPCSAGSYSFFVDPYSEVYPCNGVNWSMGNIKKQSFKELWNSNKAQEIREKTNTCNNCWMICSVRAKLKKQKLRIFSWILLNKIKKYYKPQGVKKCL